MKEIIKRFLKDERIIQREDDVKESKKVFYL